MIKEYIEYLEVFKRYSNYTIKSYKEDIGEYLAFLDKNKIDYKDVEENIIRLYLTEIFNNKLSRNSISRHLSSLRSFYNYLLNNGFVSYNYFNDLSNPKKERKLPNFLNNKDICMMLDTPDINTPLGQRNRLILEMLYATGLRVGELINIKIRDIDFYNLNIKVMGKGSKERYVFYGSYCEDILDLYLKDGRVKLNVKNNDYLFLNSYGGRLSDRYVRIIINDIIKKCSIDSKVSPHTLRHTFATHMLNEGADLMAVKELLGHTSLSTTSIYTHITDDRIKSVYMNAHPRAKE